jgi:beta-1,4-mannosyltransferase
VTALVASFPAPIDRNPYQALLYEHLAGHGIAVASADQLSVGWLRENRNRITALHFHWPEHYYRFDQGPAPVKAFLSWVRLAVFGARLAFARLYGYRIVWTVHQLHPHESSGRALDQAAASLLVRMSNALIVLDRATGEALVQEVTPSAGKLHVIPHGSYAGVYPAGRSREEVRAALAIHPGAFVALSFGQIRRYKDLDLIVEGFSRAGIPESVLLVAGLPLDEEEARRLAEAAEERRDIVLVLDFVPDDAVAELYEAADVAVSGRSDGGTSGALVLALTLGTPIVAAATAANEELTGRGGAGWLFTPGSADSLAEALRSASAQVELRAEKARCAAELAAAMSWDDIARDTARLLTGRR